MRLLSPCLEGQGAGRAQMLNRYWVLHVLPDKDAEIATIIIGIDTFVVVTEIAFIGADRCRVGDTIVHGVDRRGTPTKEDANDASSRKTRDVAQNVFRTIVLLMSR